ncbi:MAG TPA: hypothetical protein VN794_10050, partial [Methylomirabilota bacterium]|nr:hypothetical protein [Methylomirabilota bacterium]
MPFDPWPELPRWSLGSDIFLIDDSSVDYESMQENPLSPPAPGSGGPVANSQDWPAYSYAGCGLWVEIAATTNSSVILTLHNTTSGTNYQILSRTNIEATSWVVETNVAGASGQDYTTVSIPMSGRPKTFFRAAENRTYVLETNFAGLNTTDTGDAVADTMGAVGPNHFVEILNSYIAVFDKSSGARREDTNSINFFFATPGLTNNAIDPRIVYDQQA